MASVSLFHPGLRAALCGVGLAALANQALANDAVAVTTDLSTAGSSGQGLVWQPRSLALAREGASGTSFFGQDLDAGWEASPVRGLGAVGSVDWPRGPLSLRWRSAAAPDAALVPGARRWFAGLGLRRSLASLNGLPDQAVPGERLLLGGGYRFDQQSLALQVVRGSLPGLRQTSLQLVYGAVMGNSQQLSVGLATSRGEWAVVSTQRLGLMVRYGWPQYFVQLGYDAKAGPLVPDGWRLTAGTRF